MPVFRPREFIYSENRNETLATLKDGGKAAHVIAGGTGFYELARRGLVPEVKQIISIMKLGLDYLDLTSDPIKIGATTKLQSLLESGIGNLRGLEAIGDSLSEIRPIQIRNVATVGGEVCISVPIVDLPPALLAASSSVKIVGASSEKVVQLDEFYIDAFLTLLNRGEIVSEVQIPKPRDGFASAFEKIGRTAYDFNLINVAASMSLDDDDKVKSLRVFLGGIKRVPFRAEAFEKKMLRKPVEEEAIFQAAKALQDEKLLPYVHGSSEYKHQILPIILRDCIMKAKERLLKRRKMK
jgi:CO/xanthine dehydrogenase FAD-binding subunit